jgi:crotonobetainyl-CoA:carnitine CoA-transferase CaiB-like acyl-CoA transferase
VYQLLEGVKALELSHLWPSVTGQLLADLGAEIILVEEPKKGNLSRGGRAGKSDVSMHHELWNRSKKSLTLDLKAPEGHALFLELVGKVDMVIDGLRGGAMEGLRLGYEALRAANPAIVYVSITGWGQETPYRRLRTQGAGFDGYAGVQPAIYRPDGLAQLPDLAGTRGEAHHGTYVGVLHAALGATAAYVRRLRTGEGAYVDVAMADAGASCLMDHFFYLLSLRPEERPEPWPTYRYTRYQYYATKDDKAVFFASPWDHFWTRFCEAVGRPDLVGSERDQEPERVEVAKIMRTKTRAEWVQFGLEQELSLAPVYSPEEVLDDPHSQARDLVAETDHPRRGKLRMFGTPIKVKGQQFEVRAAPELGQHTDAVLRDLGIAEDRIRELRARSVIR